VYSSSLRIWGCADINLVIAHTLHLPSPPPRRTSQKHKGVQFMVCSPIRTSEIWRSKSACSLHRMYVTFPGRAGSKWLDNVPLHIVVVKSPHLFPLDFSVNLGIYKSDCRPPSCFHHLFPYREFSKRRSAEAWCVFLRPSKMKNENTHVRCFESNLKTLDMSAPVVFSVRYPKISTLHWWRIWAGQRWFRDWRNVSESGSTPKAAQYGGMWRLLSNIWIKLKKALWGLRAAKLQVRIYEACFLLLPSFDYITCITSKLFKSSDGRKMVCSSAGCHKIRSGSYICLLARGQFRKPLSWPHMRWLLSPTKKYPQLRRWKALRAVLLQVQ
jgi:hypothetical protein